MVWTCLPVERPYRPVSVQPDSLSDLFENSSSCARGQVVETLGPAEGKSLNASGKVRALFSNPGLEGLEVASKWPRQKDTPRTLPDLCGPRCSKGDALSLREAWGNLHLLLKERTKLEMAVQGWLRWCCSAALCTILILGATRPAKGQVLGDVNCDGELSGNDLLYATHLLFDPPPVGCSWPDVNLDGRSTAADLVAAASVIIAPPPVGPEITFLGVAAADGTPVRSSGSLAGALVYHRPAGQGFKLVIEARPGSSGVSVGQTVFALDPRDPSIRPDLWILVSRPLGDGSPAVCEGGVPAVHPPDLRPLRRISDAINDLSCNFAVATAPAFACTSDRFGRPAFMSDATQVQFCLQVTRQLIFADGETLVTVAVRDRAGNLGPLVQMRLRVGPGPFEPTATATRTVTATATTARVSPSFTPTASRTATRTLAPTASATGTLPPSASSTPSPTASGPVPTATRSPTMTPMRPSPTATAPSAAVSPTPTWSPSATSFASATSTPSPLLTLSSTPSRTRERTATPTRSSGSITATHTATPSRSPTPVASATPTRSRSATPSSTRTPTRSPTAPPGPVIRFFGLTRSDDTLLEPIGATAQGIPIFQRPQGFGFNIVIEAARGPSGKEVGNDTFVPSLNALPDLQIVSSRPLGDGSDAVCDSTGANAGGVPALDPPSYLPTETNIRIMNDFGCRFVDGSGNPRGRGSQEACTRVPPELDFRFVSADTSTQFCAPVTRVLEFPPGDTVLTARVLDQDSADAAPGSGLPGPTAQIVVRVIGSGPVTFTPSSSPTLTRSPSPSTTPTQRATPGSPAATATSVGPSPSPTRTLSRTPTNTRTPSPTPSVTAATSVPMVTFFGLARADGSLLEPIEVTAQGIPVFARSLGAGFLIVIEAKAGPAGAAVGLSTYQPDLASVPDLQIVASQALGNGSEEVCDYRGVSAGGVPAIDPPQFDNVAVVNDLACRFRDGADEPRGRSLADACVLFGSGAFGFVRPDSAVQFCAFVDRAWEFPVGDTLLTARVRDTAGSVSAVAQIIVRVSG